MEVLAMGKRGPEQFETLQEAIDYLKEEGGKIIIPPGYSIDVKTVIELEGTGKAPLQKVTCYGIKERLGIDDAPNRITITCFPSESARQLWMEQSNRNFALEANSPILNFVELAPYQSVTIKAPKNYVMRTKVEQPEGAVKIPPVETEQNPNPEDVPEFLKEPGTTAEMPELDVDEPYLEPTAEPEPIPVEKPKKRKRGRPRKKSVKTA